MAGTRPKLNKVCRRVAYAVLATVWFDKSMLTLNDGGILHEMIIYRFEKNGIGPYMRRFTLGFGTFHRKKPSSKASKKYARIFEENVKKLHSNYATYVKVHSSKKYLYGTSSKELLRAYFGGEFKALFKDGYRIKRYNVPDEEVIDLGVEVAFPVKYHKLQTVNGIRKRLDNNEW